MLRFAAITAFCLVTLLGLRDAAADETTLIFATANPAEIPSKRFVHAPLGASHQRRRKGVMSIDVRDGSAFAVACNAYVR